MPDAVKLALSAAVRQIGQADIRGVRTVRPDGIHLTLKFLGDIEAGRVAEVSEAIDRATAGLDPFDLGLGKAGVFPNWRSPRVLWIGLDGDLEALGRLHEAVEREIVALGLEAGQPGVPTSPDAGSGPRQCNFRGQAPRLGGALGIEDSGGTANTWQSCEFNAHDIHATRRSSRRVVFRVVARKLTL